MQLRRVEKVGLLGALVVGAALTPGAISTDVRTTLVTFFGLFSASILPTISLLINSMAASGRSVHAIDKLEAELQAAMDALFFLFGCVALAIGALILLAVKWPSQVPIFSAEILPRSGQAIVVAAAVMIVLRAGQIPAILRRSLAVRHEIALAEARRKLEENAPGQDEMRQAFARHPDFGKRVTLEELQGREPH